MRPSIRKILLSIGVISLTALPLKAQLQDQRRNFFRGNNRRRQSQFHEF